MSLVEELKDLYHSEKIDKKFIAHCNYSIRWARKMAKRYGQSDLYGETVHDMIVARTKAKKAMTAREAKIRLYEALKGLA